MLSSTFYLENITLTYQGDHTGLGRIDFKHISVVSMGPHYFPLGELSRFGIFREGEDLSDVEVSVNKISGWTKLIAGDRPFGSGATWIHFSVEKESEKTKVSASFENGKGEDPFAFVFFIKADSIKLNEKKIDRGSLISYKGPNSLIECVSGNEKILLHSEIKSPIQIIPLAGGEFFWGADFLLAFEIDDLNQKYEWIFVESMK
jgi:hypothetical protein